MESIPVWVQILTVVAAAFGLKEFGLAGFNWLTGRQKAAGELTAQGLANQQVVMEQLDRMTERVSELLEQSETLAEDKRQAERRVVARDAVIEYQKTELLDLHENYTKIREEVAVMRHQMETMAKAQSELTEVTMRQTATLERLKAEGKWEGFQNGGTTG